MQFAVPHGSLIFGKNIWSVCAIRAASFADPLICQWMSLFIWEAGLQSLASNEVMAAAVSLR